MAIQEEGSAFSFGIGLSVTSWAFFRISGAMFNPAIAFSSLITGHISVPKFVLYFISQLFSAILGVALARGIHLRNTLVRLMNSPLCGAIVATGLHILFRYMDFDQYAVEAENRSRLLRPQAALDSDHHHDC
ncbi:MAG: hypothetical protein J3Q66DRAFT_441237 [Benniella sp.]|nr:MAG: hypothetical protein J3Q66DRAFT_441237 [Benniella sp.]